MLELDTELNVFTDGGRRLKPAGGWANCIGFCGGNWLGGIEWEGGKMLDEVDRVREWA